MFVNFYLANEVENAGVEMNKIDKHKDHENNIQKVPFPKIVLSPYI